MKGRGERQAQGGDKKSKSAGTTLIQPAALKDLGITRDQSLKWQQRRDSDFAIRRISLGTPSALPLMTANRAAEPCIFRLTVRLG
jgi:hypothetical protein